MFAFDAVLVSGVDMTGGDRATLTPCGHLVENCHIHHYSRWVVKTGINLEEVGLCTRYNLAHHVPNQAIRFRGNDDLVEYNEVHSICLETKDAGAIYTARDCAARGNIIRYNFFHDMYGLRGEGCNGVYLDDNFSSGEIHGNIFYRCWKPVHLGGRRDHYVHDNLFIDCRKSLHIDARGLDWRAYGKEELTETLKRWPIDQEPWRSRYPHTDQLKVSRSI